MTLENIKSQIAELLVYTAIFIAALAVFIINGTDGNALALKLESVIEQNSNAVVKIGNAQLSLPASLTLANVTVDDKAGTRLKFKNISLRPLLLPLLAGSVTLRIVARTTNGELGIDLSTTGIGTKLRRIKIRASDVAMQEIVLSASGSPLPIHGEVSGGGYLQFSGNPMQLSELTGAVTISLEKVKIKTAVLGETLGKNLNPKKISCKLAIEQRKLTINQCEAETAAGKFELRVSSRLLKSVAASPLRGTLVVTPAEGPLKRFLAIYPNRRKPDGGYHFSLKGTLAMPGINL